MTSALTDELISKKIMDRARKLYESLALELEHGLEKLKGGKEDPDAKARAETIKAHRRALQTVLEIEAQFLREAERAESVRAIDVEAAKREIYRRLDRQVAADETESPD